MSTFVTFISFILIIHLVYLLVRQMDLHLQWHLHLGLLLDVLYVKIKAVHITGTLRYSVLLSILNDREGGLQGDLCLQVLTCAVKKVIYSKIVNA